MTVTPVAVIHSRATSPGRRRIQQYLASPKVRKDELAREIAKRDTIDEGLICVFKTVEPLRGFAIHRNREAKKHELRMEQRSRFP